MMSQLLFDTRDLEFASGVDVLGGQEFKKFKLIYEILMKGRGNEDGFGFGRKAKKAKILSFLYVALQVLPVLAQSE